MHSPLQHWDWFAAAQFTRGLLKKLAWAGFTSDGTQHLVRLQLARGSQQLVIAVPEQTPVLPAPLTPPLFGEQHLEVVVLSFRHTPLQQFVSVVHLVVEPLAPEGVQQTVGVIVPSLARHVSVAGPPVVAVVAQQWVAPVVASVLQVAPTAPQFVLA